MPGWNIMTPTRQADFEVYPRSTLGGSRGIRPQSLTSCFNSRIFTYASLYNAIHEVTNHETSLLNLYHLVSCIVYLLLYRIN